MRGAQPSPAHPSPAPAPAALLASPQQGLWPQAAAAAGILAHSCFLHWSRVMVLKESRPCCSWTSSRSQPKDRDQDHGGVSTPSWGAGGRQYVTSEGSGLAVQGQPVLLAVEALALMLWGDLGLPHMGCPLHCPCSSSSRLRGEEGQWDKHFQWKIISLDDLFLGYPTQEVALGSLTSPEAQSEAVAEVRVPLML